MFEIYMIKSLAEKIECTAILKGLNGGVWKAIAISAWILAELLGTGICYRITTNLLMSLVICGYPLAFLSYFLVKWKLSSYPDKDEWINDIGSSNEGI